MALDFFRFFEQGIGSKKPQMLQINASHPNHGMGLIKPGLLLIQFLIQKHVIQMKKGSCLMTAYFTHVIRALTACGEGLFILIFRDGNIVMIVVLVVANFEMKLTT